MAIPLSLSEVPAATPYVQYVATSGQTVFPYPFPITQDSDLIVVYNGVTLATDAGYTLSGQGNDTGGNVTFTAGATVGDIVTLYRDIAIERLTQIGQNSGFSSSAFNAEFNNIYLILQQLEASVSQCLQIPNTNNPAPVTGLTPGSYANKYLAFDGNGNPEPAALTSSGSITGSILSAILSVFTTAAITPDRVRTPAEIAEGVTPVNFAYAPGMVDRYGTNTTPGTTDMTTAWAAAIAQASRASGAKITAGAGPYLIVGSGGTGIQLNANGISIEGIGTGPTMILAGAANLRLLCLSQSYCSLRRLTLSGNGQAGVDGLVLAPANESVTGVTNQNNWNDLTDLKITLCNNGIRARPGPTVAGSDSGCYYNTVRVALIDNVRHLWMQDSVNDGNAGVNRNFWYGGIANFGGQGNNTGVQIDNGATNTFLGFTINGINVGTSPNTTPTAVKIVNAAASSEANNDNQFFGCMFEANTRDLDNANPSTAIYGGTWSASKFGGGAVLPRLMIGGDPSIMPQILPGLQYSEGVSGFPSGYWGMSKEIADTGLQWQSYALTTSNVTNVASLVSMVSKYRQLANMVSWHFTFSFDASASGTLISITPPVTPNAALYSTLATDNSFYTFTVSDGTGTNKIVEGGWTSTGKLYVKAPSGGWNTGGNNNALFVAIDYHV